MDPGADERGREVRTRLLGAALVVAAVAPAAAHADTTTGRLLVTLKPTQKATASATAIAARAGARPVTGRSVPQIRLMTVRRAGRASLKTVARRLRAQPGVARVEVEHRYTLRAVPNDPALAAPELAPGTTPGTPVQWWAAREGFPAAWDITQGAGAKVAIIDTGADATHPDLAGRIAQSVDADDTTNTPATTDEVGHGTFDASIACATANNAIGIAGAGYGCSLLVFKSDFSDSSVAKSLIQAADGGAEAVSMSFGSSGQYAAAQPVVDALNYAARKGTVPVAAAADDPVTEQGDPSNVLQPTGSGPDITKGIGLSVTAANAADQRATFAGLGTQISIAAYGAWQLPGGGPRGLLGAFPAAPTMLEAGGLNGQACACRTSFQGDTRYAYLQGTSMATPQVAAVAALMRHVNPDLDTARTVYELKQTARRATGGFTDDLGWGILDAGAALNAARSIDAHAPAATLKASTNRRTRVVTLALTGDDAGPPGVAASGVRSFRVFRRRGGGKWTRIATTSKTRVHVKIRRRTTYRFYALATDKAGNAQTSPTKVSPRIRLKR